MVTILIIIILLIAVAAIFYRPFGTGYYSYTPAGFLFAIVILLLILYLLGVI